MKFQNSSARGRVLVAMLAPIVMITLSACAASAPAPPKVSAPPVSATDITHGTLPYAGEISAPEGNVVTTRKITIRPGGTTGKHCHYGNILGTIQAGTLTHYAPTYAEGSHTYHAGDALVEGPGYLHEGRNEGTEDVILWATYISPPNKELAETDAATCAAVPMH